MPVLNLVVAVLRGSIGRVIAVLRDRLLLISLSVERFVLTLINEDYYYYYYITWKWCKIGCSLDNSLMGSGI